MKFTSMNLLDEMSRPEFAEIRSALRERSFAKQSLLFQPDLEDSGDQVEQHGSQGFPSHAGHGAIPAGRMSPANNYVFIVMAGRVRVYLAYGDKEFTIAILEPGDIYTSHTGTYVQAMDDCTVLLTDIATFHNRMMDVPQFTKTMVRVLGGILKNAFGIIDGLVFRDSTARLAVFLLDSAQTEDGVRVVHLNMTGELLAQHLGTTRQTVSTLLNDLTRSKILHREKRGVYHILDEARLREMVA